MNVEMLEMYGFLITLIELDTFCTLPICIRNHHTEFESNKTTLKCLINEFEKPKIVIIKMDILVLFHFLQGTKLPKDQSLKV